MTDPALIEICSSREVIQRLAVRSAGQQRLQVWYFADDYSVYAQLLSDFSTHHDIVDLGPDLNADAARLRDDLVNIDELIGANPDSLGWETSTLAERSHYTGSVAVHLARIFVFVERALSTPGPHLCVVDHADLAEALATVARSRGRTIRRRSINRAHLVAARFRRCLSWGRAVVRRLNRLGQIKKQRHVHPAALERLRACDVLLVSWVGTDSFSPGGMFLPSSNLGALPQVLRAAGLKIGILGIPLDWLSPFETIIANAMGSSEPVLILDECLTRRSILRAAFQSMLPPSPQVTTANLSQTVDFIPLVNAMLKADRFAPRRFYSCLFAAVGTYLQNHDITPPAVVFPFENQSWERALRRGMRERLPQTRLVGWQHAPFSPFYLSFFPSRREIEADLLPDVIAVPGQYWRDQIRATGLPADRLVVVGSTRYRGSSPDVVAGSSPTSAVRLLCATGIDYDEAFELAYKVAKATEGLKLSVTVNFHPYLDPSDRERLKTNIERLVPGSSTRLRYSTDPVRSLLPSADVLLYNTSAAAFDALGQGIPVIYVGRDLTIDQNKVPRKLCLERTSVESLSHLFRTELELVVRPEDLQAKYDQCLGIIDTSQILAILDRRAVAQDPIQGH